MEECDEDLGKGGENENVGSEGGGRWNKVRAQISRETKILIPTNVC